MIGARPWAKDAAWLAGTLLLVLAGDVGGGDRGSTVSGVGDAGLLGAA